MNRREEEKGIIEEGTLTGPFNFCDTYKGGVPEYDVLSKGYNFCYTSPPILFCRLISLIE